MLAHQPRRISKEEFLRRYSDKEDGYKYEWNGGLVEKTRAMNQRQSILHGILNLIFIKTQMFKQGGMFFAESEMDTTASQMRKPDLAIYSGEQVRQIKNGKKQVALWVGEVISPTDNADKINEKLDEYFLAGVRVVWHIFPAAKKVDVYTSPDNVTICRGKTICSGAPALPDFEIAAQDLFS